MALAHGGTRRPDERFRVIAAVLSLWMTFGVFFDAWSHFTSDKVESFFTPAHGVLYSGFLASAGWLMSSLFRRGPRVDRLAIAGIGVFLAGGLSDFAWHALRGFETGPAVRISPPHLVLFAGGWLMASYSARVALRDRRLVVVPWSVVLSVTAAAAAAAFPGVRFNVFTQEWDLASRAAEAARFEGPATAIGRDSLIYGKVLPMLLGTTVLLVVPLVFIVRHWRPRIGTSTALFAGFALLTSLSRNFDAPPIVVAGIVAGVLIDACLALLVRHCSPARLVVASSITASVILWACVLTAAGQTGRLEGGPLELWAGGVCLSVLVAWGLASALAASSLTSTDADMNVVSAPDDEEDTVIEADGGELLPVSPLVLSRR